MDLEGVIGQLFPIPTRGGNGGSGGHMMHSRSSRTSGGGRMGGGAHPSPVKSLSSKENTTDGSNLNHSVEGLQRKTKGLLEDLKEAVMAKHFLALLPQK